MLKLTKLESKKLRKRLPEKASDTLAQKYNHSRRYINMILKGDRTNEPVLLEAMRMADAEDLRIANLKNNGSTK